MFVWNKVHSFSMVLQSAYLELINRYLDIICTCVSSLKKKYLYKTTRMGVVHAWHFQSASTHVFIIGLTMFFGVIFRVNIWEIDFSKRRQRPGSV